MGYGAAEIFFGRHVPKIDTISLTPARIPFNIRKSKMKGERREVVAFRPQREGISGAKKRQTAPGPQFNTFFLSARVLAGLEPFSSPYNQIAWYYNSVRRIATSLSSVPFRIFTDTGASDVPEAEAGEGREAFKTRRQAFKRLRAKHPAIDEFVYEQFYDHGPKMRRAVAREYFTRIRQRAWTAPPYLIAKALGLEIVEEGQWHALFRDVNSEMTKAMLWEATTIHLNNGGRCFWRLLGPDAKPWVYNQDNKAPLALWVHDGRHNWKPMENDKTRERVGWVFSDERFLPKGQKEQELKANQVLHFRLYDPTRPREGMGPADAMSIELETDYDAAKYNRNFFRQGAQLSGFFHAPEGLSDEDRMDIEEMLERDFQGVENAHGVRIFEGKGEFVPTGVRQRDMEYLRGREWTRDVALAGVGAPKSEMGIFQDVNRASAIVSKRVMWENTNLPLMTYYEDLIDSDLMRPVTQGLFWGAFDTSSVHALRDDMLEKARAGKTLFDMGFTPNEINERLEMGFEDEEWRGVAWLPKSLVPYNDDPFKEPPPPPGGTPPPPGEEEPESPQGGEPGESEEPGTAPPEAPEEGEEGEPGEGGEESGARPSLRPRDIKVRGDFSRSRRLEIAQRIEEVVTIPGESLVRDVVKPLIWRIRAAQLAKIGDAEPATITEPSALLFDPQPFKRELRLKMEPVYRRIFDLAEEEVNDELIEIGLGEELLAGRAFDENDTEITELTVSLATRVQSIVDSIRGPLLETFREEIEAAIAEGEPIDGDELKARVREKFAIFGGAAWNRRIAFTESATATSMSRKLVFGRRRVPSQVWLNVGDDRVRDDHNTLDDGVPRPLDFNFGSLLGGGVILFFPLDPRAPSDQTINCRCALLPHTSTEPSEF